MYNSLRIHEFPLMQVAQYGNIDLQPLQGEVGTTATFDKFGEIFKLTYHIVFYYLV